MDLRRWPKIEPKLGKRLVFSRATHIELVQLWFNEGKHVAGREKVIRLKLFFIQQKYCLKKWKSTCNLSKIDQRAFSVIIINKKGRFSSFEVDYCLSEIVHDDLFTSMIMLNSYNGYYFF